MLHLQTLKSSFEQLGARVEFGEMSVSRPWHPAPRYSFRIESIADEDGHFFSIRTDVFHRAALTADVRDVCTRRRALLFSVGCGDEKERCCYLCGHDGARWYVESVPTDETAASVAEALSVCGVDVAETVSTQTEQTEDNCGSSDSAADKGNGGRGGRLHMVEYIHQRGEETIFVCNEFPNGMTEGDFRRLVLNNPHKRLSNGLAGQDTPGTRQFVKRPVFLPFGATSPAGATERIGQKSEGNLALK